MGRFVLLPWLAVLVVLMMSSCSDAALCSNPVPGLDKISHGIDVTSFDLFAKDNLGLKRQAIEYTCDETKTVTIEGKTYQLPDQVESVTVIPGGVFNAVTDLVTSYKNIRTTTAKDFGAEGLIKMFGFSASHSLQSMEETFVNKSRYIERVSAFESARKAFLNPDFILKPHRYFQYYVDNLLPNDYDPSNPAPYTRLIKEYGTHYFQSGNFGGLVMVEFQTKSQYFLKNSDSSVKAEAQASYLEILKAMGGHSSSTSQVTNEFKRMSTHTVRYFGGRISVLDSDGITAWQKTVPFQPWLFSGKLAPLSNLIRNDSKRLGMATAVTQHILRAYLDELSRLLSSRVWHWSQQLGRLRQLLTRVTSLKNKTLLTENGVDGLAQEIYEELLIPRWFNERTELCFDWYPDGDGGQCAGPSRKLCASPGLMTSEYRDDTDRRPGGCRMSWSIRSSDNDAWFNAVKICFRWHPDGDGGQCGGGAARELCAPVNRGTPVYRDDTDRRSGGCQMSWRVVVPGSAPVWAHNIKLCYVWRADGDGGQCGGGASTHLCALANSWTSYYRDDTDRRSGGCRMTWGLSIDGTSG